MAIEGAAVRRPILGALVMLLSILGPLAPSATLAQRASCPTQPSNIFEYVDFAGRWERHGMTLEVGRLGCGELTWRTYRWCPPGRSANCDRVQDGTIRFGGVADFALRAPHDATADGRIVATSDPDRVAGRDIALVLNDDGTLMVEWDDRALIFCRPWLHDPDRCGA